MPEQRTFHVHTAGLHRDRGELTLDELIDAFPGRGRKWEYSTPDDELDRIVIAIERDDGQTVAWAVEHKP